MEDIDIARVLWISADDSLPRPAREAAGCGGFSLDHAPGIPEALEYLRRSRIAAAVCCFPIPDWTPAEVLEALARADERVSTIIWDPQASPSDAAAWIRSGAFQILGRDSSPEDVARAVNEAIADRRSRPPAEAESAETWRRMLVGSSRPFEDVVRTVRLVGPRRANVLLTGETGTGKEMVARAIHLAGPRGHQPLVAVCCSALPENLLEAELFGHVRGAFTGAINQRIGRFEQAHGSTLFLDEIADMPLDLQAKLLRVLQEREFQRLGSSETVRVDVRVVAATNADLAERVRQGRFREDLYYRLNVVPIHLPPLRERAGDVMALAQHLVEKVCRLENLPLRKLGREALDRLARYTWPGNVRQLENAVERAIILSGERTLLYPSDFALPLAQPRPAASAAPVVRVPDDGLDFEQTVGQIARGIIAQALEKSHGNKKVAADLLRLKRTTLAAKLRSLDGAPDDLEVLKSDFGHSA